MTKINRILDELESLKIRDIKLYNAEGKSILADYFILGTADSAIQLEGVRTKLVDLLWKEYRASLKNPEENWHGGWCLLDFSDIVIHIFLEETRSFYHLDALMENLTYTLEVQQTA